MGTQPARLPVCDQKTDLPTICLETAETPPMALHSSQAPGLSTKGGLLSHHTFLPATVRAAYCPRLLSNLPASAQAASSARHALRDIPFMLFPGQPFCDPDQMTCSHMHLLPPSLAFSPQRCTVCLHVSLQAHELLRAKQASFLFAGLQRPSTEKTLSNRLVNG